VDEMRNLSLRRTLFVLAYCDMKADTCGNATRSAIAAHYALSCANEQGSRLLANDDVQAAIAERKVELASAAGLTREWVLHHWKQQAEADPNELILIRKGCCRNCWGADGRYQWVDAAEYQAACERALSGKVKRDLPDPLGGFGFDGRKEPNADCAACMGEGYETVIAKDTRHLSPGAQSLYAGVEKTKDGLKIKMHDQAAARLNIAKYLGMSIERREITGLNGAPLGAAVDPDDMSDADLIRIAQKPEEQPEKPQLVN
jgi:phage terminase small subunit